MYIDPADGPAILMLPQPDTLGSTYAYSGAHVRILNGAGEVSSVREEEINKGLGYAFLVGHLENFSLMQKYYFTPGVHSNLRYRGHDPAILTILDSSYNGESMCVGAPNQNLIDAGNYHAVFNTSSSCHGPCTLQSDDMPAYWTLGRELHTVGASKATLDHRGKPMGTVTVDVDMGTLGESFLDSLGFSPSVYALIVERSGRIIYLTPVARAFIFGDRVEEDIIYNVDGSVRCSTDRPHDCTWKPRKSIKILAAADKTLFSGVDFSPVLEDMFGPSGANCSTNVLSKMVKYPKTNYDGVWSNTSAMHLVSFCTLVSVPEWGLIIGTTFMDVADAASMAVAPEELIVDPSKHQMQEIIGNQVTLTNTGRVTLPFQVDKAHADFVHIEPQQGVLLPDQSVIIHVTLHNVSALRSGTSFSGVLTVRGNTQKSRGTCFRKAAHVRLSVTVPKWSWTPVQRFVIFYGEWVFGIAVVMATVVLARLAYTLTRRYFQQEARKSNIVSEAMQSTKLLPYPMVLIAASEFKRLGRLVSHEEVRHVSTWLDSIDEVKAFCSKNHVVFVSHQWTAFDCPDPTNIQYKAMLMSIDTLQHQEDWEEENIFLWVDFSSIPQKHSPTQAAAINSLTVYASNVSAFVVVAPEVQHHQLPDLCNKASYQQRAWCRAEQLAHLLAVGSRNMYLAEDGELTPLSDIDDWLTQSIYVFNGNLTCCRRKHEGMAKCDKELLRTPMLGLWAQLNERCSLDRKEQPARRSIAGGSQSEKLRRIDHVYEEISKKLDEVFPREFNFECPDGHVEKRQLFGDLLTRLPQPGDDQEEDGA